MGTLDEVKRMQGEGKAEGEIRGTLKQKGISEEEINNAMSQTQIKDAVSDVQGASAAGQGGQEQLQAPSPTNQGGESVSQISLGNVNEPQATEYSAQTPANYEGMHPSMLVQEQEQQPSAYSTVGSSNAYAGDYPQYQPYQETMSSDVITEISEQVVEEKLAIMRDKLEEAIGFKTTAEAKIASIDERLKRIEHVIDKLQLSLLQRVGEYVTDVKDIKNEMVETQKSFKTLLGGKTHHKAHGKKIKHPHSKEEENHKKP